MSKINIENEKADMMKTAKGGDLISLALYAFGGLGIEVIYAFLLEPMIYGSSMQEWNTGQSILHWTITCITWGFISFFLIRHAKNKYAVTVTAEEKRIKIWQWILVLVCMAVNLAWSIYSWDGFKIFIEFQGRGALKFIFQYIYYLFETGLFILIIIFGQKGFEIWFHQGKTVNIPYGGLFLAITWGLVHMFTKGSLEVGLSAAGSSILFGVVYLLLNRNYKWSYFILFFMFIL